MFTNTLDSSWDERSRRGLTALTSFGLQVLVGALLLLLPLLRPMGLPSLRQLSPPVSLGQPRGEAPAARMQTRGNTVSSSPVAIALRMPVRNPSDIPVASDDGPPTVGPSGPSLPGAF